MPLAPALSAALSPRYRVTRELGAGGMATVYLARDLKHDRDVAIKVLHADLAASVGAERFDAEIKTTARLKHPNILPLFDSGAADGTLFYVMPFVDGESVRERVRRTGSLPIDETVRILHEIADALAYAHATGVVHRDIKSDNVMLGGGHAYLADFGIARAIAAREAGATVSGSGAGVGTPAYMSPEQIVGGAVDQRTDLYGLGSLGYEMLTGAPPFTGSRQDVLTAHLTRTVEPLRRRRADAPQALADVIMRCLEKDPGARPARAEDVRRVLEEVAASRAGSATATANRALRRTIGAAAAIGVLASLVFAWYAWRMAEAPASLTIGRLTRVTTSPGLELDPALSPDGRTIAYAAGTPGHTRIYVREFAGGRAVALTEGDTDEAQRWPQWSPDGSRIVFQSGRVQLVSGATRSAGLGSLYLATPLGGSARRIALPIPGGLAVSPSWSPDGRSLVFAGSAGIYAMPVDGNEAPRLLVGGAELHSPRWSPDATKITYVARASLFTFGADSLGNVETGTLMVLSLATGRTVAITRGDGLDTNPSWMPDSRTLLFVSGRGGGRDVYSVRLAEDGRPLHEPERLTSGVAAHGITIARDGRLLVYSSYTPNANIWSVRIPDTGAVSVSEAQPATAGSEKIEKLAISPDRQWLAYDSDVNGPADVWKMPLAGGRPEQLTHGPFHKFVNAWSPDGREIVYHSILADGQRDLFIVSADGAHVERVTNTPREDEHAGWSPDGNAIVYDSTARGGRSEAFIVRRAHPGAPWGTPWQLTKNGSTDPKWSPDDRLIAFCVDGQLRVISPDASGEHTLVDAYAGSLPEPQYPMWSSDSRTIFYKAYDLARHSTIWSVPAAGGTPRLMVTFDDPARRSMRREFAMDGRRFYFTVARDESDLSAVELVRR